MVKKRRPHDELEADVIQLALQTIAQGSLSALSARGLAGGAGISVGTLYNLFGDLDGVVRAVNRDTLQHMEQKFGAAMEPADSDAETRLISLADAYYDFGREETNRWAALFQYRFAEAGTDEQMDAAEDRLFGLLRTAAGDAATDEALRALWAAVHGVVDLAVSQRLKGATDDGERRYVHLIVRAGLRGLAALDDAT